MPTRFYGDTYTLETKEAVGKTDLFESILTANFKRQGKHYTGKVDVYAHVHINK